MKKNTKGFTLIELLVVIAIIGLLATLSVVALNTARVKARDARRQADVHQIQVALEMYNSTNGYYPSLTADIGTSTYYICSDNGVTTTACGATMLLKVPTAPLPYDTGTTGYSYTQASATGTTYTLTYCLSTSGGGCATATPASYK